MTGQKRVLFSLTNKTGLAKFAGALAQLDWGDFVATTGTATTLREAGFKTLVTSDISGIDDALGGRLRSIHHQITGAILAIPDDPDHVRDMERLHLRPIHMVVANLYDFASAVRSGASVAECIAKIDVGGVLMIRAAGKNFERVVVVVDPADYDMVAEEISELSYVRYETRVSLARKAFAYTTAYDAAVTAWFDKLSSNTLLPDTINLILTKDPVALRNGEGENPHQKGAAYNVNGEEPWAANVTTLGGQPMSFNNDRDTDTAWCIVHDEAFGDDATAVVVKHNNPAGFAIAETIADACDLAIQCDRDAVFGGILALNRTVDNETCRVIVEANQFDVIIAPGFDEDVVDRLIARRKNTRILRAYPPGRNKLEFQQVSGRFLVQEPHYFGKSVTDWKVVTDRKPTAEQMTDAWVAHVLGRWCSSNSAVLCLNRVAYGIGVGQQRRSDSMKIADDKSAGRAAGGVLGSDGFIAFKDALEAAAASRADVIVQPGGSTSDYTMIETANELGLVMFFTGERQFRH